MFDRWIDEREIAEMFNIHIGGAESLAKLAWFPKPKPVNPNAVGCVGPLWRLREVHAALSEHRNELPPSLHLPQLQ